MASGGTARPSPAPMGRSCPWFPAWKQVNSSLIPAEAAQSFSVLPASSVPRGQCGAASWVPGAFQGSSDQQWCWSQPASPGQDERDVLV